MAGIEPVGIDFVGVEIGYGDAEGVTFHPGIDVHRHEDGVHSLIDHSVGHGEDAVVGDVQIEGKGGGAVAAVDAQGSAVVVDGDTFEEVTFFAQSIDLTDDLAGVASGVIVVFLELVEFFDDGEGEDDFMLTEHEDGAGIVEQDIGVEDEVGLAGFFERGGIDEGSGICGFIARGIYGSSGI